MTDAPLPGTLAQIARHIGRDAALQLALTFGGGRLNIPMTPTKGGDIEQAIGAEAAAKLSAAYPGDRLLIPAAKRALIFWLTAKGMSRRDVALELKTSERTVYDTLSEKKADRQPDLFDRFKAG